MKSSHRNQSNNSLSNLSNNNSSNNNNSMNQYMNNNNNNNIYDNIYDDEYNNISNKIIDEKKKRRLERNRESARECRKRKKDKITLLRQQLTHLEADNLQLRLKLQIGPEAAKVLNDKFNDITAKLEKMINDGSSENDIRKQVSEIQEKYSDYGRERESKLDFHINQLNKCLQPTQTTKTILWLINVAPNFYENDGTIKANANCNDTLALLWKDLHQTISPTKEQCRQLINLASDPMDNLFNNNLSSTSTVSDSEEMLSRLHDLVAIKNKSLDHEMSELQNILSANQIARFIVWINQNPVVLQMLEALWPHFSQNDMKDSYSESD